ncbi:MAG: beta-hydroxyacyl-(acyl-carrier-protein) dehydratase [Candidatus Brocadia sinica]|nr:MAG: beta-hydroxyacyl-(acyl-carrier-protein) dehydratase [Candidatus Brocadia sinica]
MEYIKRYTLFTGFYKINFSCIIMPQDILTDLNNLDLNKPTVDIEAIRTVIPHRYEMEQLNGIIKFDPENKIIIGYKDISNSEFWVRGHIPGRPLMPGVIMLEAAAQLCTYYYKKITQDDRFLGFGGIDKVKFRGKVIPGDKLILIAKNKELRSRRAVFDTQGVVDGKLVFEGVIIGMVV